MTKKDIWDGNILIAEFMELPKTEKYDKKYIWNKCWHTPYGLQYHRSWDALMPVIKKLYDVCINNTDDVIFIYDGLMEFDIEKTFKIIVEYLSEIIKIK